MASSGTPIVDGCMLVSFFDESGKSNCLQPIEIRIDI